MVLIFCLALLLRDNHDNKTKGVREDTSTYGAKQKIKGGKEIRGARSWRWGKVLEGWWGWGRGGRGEEQDMF